MNRVQGTSLYIDKASKAPTQLRDGVEVRDLQLPSDFSWRLQLSRNYAAMKRVYDSRDMVLMYALNSECQVHIAGESNTLIPGDCLHLPDDATVEEHRAEDCLTLELHGQAQNRKISALFEAREIGYEVHRQHAWMATRPLGAAPSFSIQLSRVTEVPICPLIPWSIVPSVWFGLQGMCSIADCGRVVNFLPGDALACCGEVNHVMTACSDDFEFLELRFRT